MSTQKQSFPSLEFRTPVGRLVSGSVSIASDKGYNGAKRETPQYFFALAVRKDDPGAIPLLTNIQNHAWQSYGATPHAAIVHSKIQHGPIGKQFPAGIQAPFAWKVEDGDAPEHASKEGWPGCWVFKFTTTLPIYCANAQNQQIDPATVQLGWFAEVAGSTVINGNADHTAGIYLNPRCVRIVGYGQQIVPGPNAAALFGDSVPALPPGASPTPVAPAAAMPQPGPGGAVMPPPPGAASAPQYAPQPQYAAPAPAPVPQAAPGVGNYTTPPAPAPQYAAPAPAVPAGAAQAPAAPGAPYTPPAGYPGTAYPSNQPAAPGYPNVQPHPGFLNPPPVGGQ